MAAEAPQPPPLYGTDSAGWANRLHREVIARAVFNESTYGGLDVDPLFSSRKLNLADSASRAAMQAVLDEFLQQHGERQITDPVARVLLQHDLWKLLDFLANRHPEPGGIASELRPLEILLGYPLSEPGATAAEPRPLQRRLAAAIRRLALSSAQIAALPDNLAAAAKSWPNAFAPAQPKTPFLPANFFAPDGPWVCLDATGNGVPAPVHVRELGTHSTFYIFVSLPGGRAETLAYLKKLNEFPEPYLSDLAELKRLLGENGSEHALMPHSFDPQHPPWVNPATPQFPPGTTFALVRQMLAIDDTGRLAATPLVESVQLRTYLSLKPESIMGGEQATHEFLLDRRKLLADNKGGLELVQPDTPGIAVFLMHVHHTVDDERVFTTLRPGPPMSCLGCHDGVGIHGVVSRAQLFITHTARPPNFTEVSPRQVPEMYMAAKRSEFSWGLLQGLWPGE